MSRLPAHCPPRRRLIGLIGLLLGLAAPLSALAQAAPPAATAEWVESSIDTPDGRLAFASLGAGPVLVVVPGGPGGSGWGQRVPFAPLAAEHRVVVIDNIGRGRSDRLADPRRYTVARDAQDIERLRLHLGVAQIAVYGHSYGGMVAQHYASSTAPQAVRRLVLGNTLHGERAWQSQIDFFKRWTQEQHPQLWAEWQAARAAGRLSGEPALSEPLGKAFAPMYWFGREAPAAGPRSAPSPDPRDRLNAEVYQAFVGPDPEWVVAGTIKGLELLPALSRVNAPSLVLTGRYDPVCPPRVADEMARALPAGRVQTRIFERSGHRPFYEEAAAWRELLLAFLR